MPTNRTRRSRAWQAELDDYRKEQLIQGPNASLLAGVGYLTATRTASLEEAPPEAQALVLAEMERDWQQHGADLMAWWNLGKEAPLLCRKPWVFPRPRPGQLPWAAKQFGQAPASPAAHDGPL